MTPRLTWVGGCGHGVGWGRGRWVGRGGESHEAVSTLSQTKTRDRDRGVADSRSGHLAAARLGTKANRVHWLRHPLWQLAESMAPPTLDTWHLLCQPVCGNAWPHKRTTRNVHSHSSGAVWESRWTSWAVRPNEPSGFRGRKDLLHRASALVTTCP